MACFSPIPAWYPQGFGQGRLVFVPNFKVGQDWKFPDVKLHCNQCFGCRLERSRQWAMRCDHERSLFTYNCFCTLTFSDSHLPENGSLSVRHLQLFMKRLRKRRFSIFRDLAETVPPSILSAGLTGILHKRPTDPGKVRFFACGEYGDKFARPHYHICLFGIDFPDKKVFGGSADKRTYTSAILDDLWDHQGHCLIAELNFSTAGYVARYVLKKMLGKNASSFYRHVDDDTGEIIDLKPEFTVMSRRPGIGRGWYDLYRKQVFRDAGATVVVNGLPMAPPLAYMRWLEVDDVEAYDRLRGQRESMASELQNDPEFSDRRLAERGVVARARQRAYGSRGYETTR